MDRDYQVIVEQFFLALLFETCVLKTKICKDFCFDCWVILVRCNYVPIGGIELFAMFVKTSFEILCSMMRQQTKI